MSAKYKPKQHECSNLHVVVTQKRTRSLARFWEYFLQATFGALDVVARRAWAVCKQISDSPSDITRDLNEGRIQEMNAALRVSICYYVSVAN